MREIIFKGKRTDTGEWVEGFYSNELYANKHYISKWYYGSYAELQNFEVIPETVGQFTGLKDCNGKKIFEGDIVKCFDITRHRENEAISKIVFFDGAWLLHESEDYGVYLYNYKQIENGLLYIEIIGNIHDNPELLN